jgi:hypothetical protein
MFKITGNAYEYLQSTVEDEKNQEAEKLYVRLSMGIG